jgi:hypothetical protein
MSTNNVKYADPLKTRTGKTRLGPLNLRQLTAMLAKESKPKNKSKIQSRIRALEKMGFKLPQEPVAEPVPEAV